MTTERKWRTTPGGDSYNYGDAEPDTSLLTLIPAKAPSTRLEIIYFARELAGHGQLFPLIIIADERDEERKRFFHDRWDVFPQGKPRHYWQMSFDGKVRGQGTNHDVSKIELAYLDAVRQVNAEFPNPITAHKFFEGPSGYNSAQV